MRTASFALTAAVILTSQIAYAQGSLPAAQAVRTTGAIHIDGRLDESVWQQAPAYSDFHLLGRKYDKGGAVVQGVSTKFQVAYNDRALFFAFTCEQPQLQDAADEAHERDGDAWANDSVEIMLAPPGEYYYHLAVNSIAAQYDARIPTKLGMAKGGRAETGRDRLWDGAWQAATVRGQHGWTAEVRIPFASLDMSPSTTSTWRLEVGRTIAQSRQNFSWAPIQSGYADLPRFGALDGVKINASRFVIDASGVKIPPLRLGDNVVELSIPIIGGPANADGGYVVQTAVVKPQAGGVDPSTVSWNQSDTPAQVRDGRLAVSFHVPVKAVGQLQMLLIKVAQADTHEPVALLAHLYTSPSPLSATLNHMVYYTSEPTADVHTTVAVASGSANGTLVTSLYEGDKLIHKQSQTIDKIGKQNVQVPIGTLPEGNYRLQMTADLKGLDAITRTVYFHVVQGPWGG